MLVTDDETRQWLRTMPVEFLDCCEIMDRIPRERMLSLIAQARVMLAPSLIDGTPNTMFEAMAAGALPIVSPLDTIIPLVQDGKNVLFARNLYPSELASALTRSMSDDQLLSDASNANLELVGKIADRRSIAPGVAQFYEELARPTVSKS
jgi:glycosyltransferase involved in cell wall biosynthesis